MLLLKQDTTKKKRVNKLLKSEKKIETRDNKEYEVESIVDSAVYGKKIKSQISNFNFLVLWKSYLEEKSIRELSAAIMHLWELINTFYKDQPENPKATFLPLDYYLPMTRLIVPKQPK